MVLRLDLVLLLRGAPRCDDSAHHHGVCHHYANSCVQALCASVKEALYAKHHI